jgi:hypothetical protein
MNEAETRAEHIDRRRRDRYRKPDEIGKVFAGFQRYLYATVP